MNNWERLTFKLLGLKPIRKDHILLNKPSWLMQSPTDILNKYGRQYLIIK